MKIRSFTLPKLSTVNPSPLQFQRFPVPEINTDALEAAIMVLPKHDQEEYLMKFTDYSVHTF